MLEQEDEKEGIMDPKFELIAGLEDIDVEKVDNSYNEVPKDSLENFEREIMYDLEELEKFQEKNMLLQKLLKESEKKKHEEHKQDTKVIY